ncbi:GNAT family N-acetyltransferase [candidate division WOR-3 bacterium]|nr:GNAT family N-acetyltransferase [candidate division WOR-3 bacterium]
MKISVKPLDKNTWPDLETLFMSGGCSAARTCWCMYYRKSGKVDLPHGVKMSDYNKRQLKKLAQKGPPPGLIGFSGKKPVGWVSLGPREDFPKLQKSPVMKPVDEKKVWSIVCFVVPKEFRNKGVATEMLNAAVKYAKKMGASIVEAYPVDKNKRGNDEWFWFGAKSMYDGAGFYEVARRCKERPIVRLDLRIKKYTIKQTSKGEQ